MSNDGPSRGWLYDVDGKDSPVRIDGSQLPRIGKKQMLWVDIDLDMAGPLDQLWDQLNIPDLSETFAHGDSRPQLVRYPGFLHVNVFALHRLAQSSDRNIRGSIRHLELPAVEHHLQLQPPRHRHRCRKLVG